MSDDEKKDGGGRVRSNFQTKMEQACDQLMREMREHPPRLTCWLRGGVNVERANEIKIFLEKEP